MITLDEQLITSMGKIADEVYNDDEYFLDSNGNRKKPIIETAYGDYTIIESISTATDMQALLLKAPDGSFVIAFRGTAGFIDALVDLSSGIFNYNPQIGAAKDFVQKVLDNPDYNIDESNLTLTGHSLGGMLTQAVGADLKIPGYAFNPYGADRLLSLPNSAALLAWLGPIGSVAHVLTYKFLTAIGVSAPNAQWAQDNILSISYTDSGVINGDILSNFLTNFTSKNIGDYLPLVGPDLGLGAHSMVQVNEAIKFYNNILLPFSGSTTYRELTRAFLENMNLDKFFTHDFQSTANTLLNDINIYDNNGFPLEFNFLRDLSAHQLAQQAKDDRAVLFALVHLNGFAVEGSLGSYSNLNLADYSSLYIEDRSLLLYHMLDSDNRDLGDLHIKDRGYGVEVGSGGWIWDNPNILFGYDGADQGYIEELIGGSNTYTIDPITETLPTLRGYGYIEDSFKSYNLDIEIQRKAA